MRILSNSGAVTYGLQHLLFNTEEELKAVDTSSLIPGSQAYITKTSQNFILNEQLEWKQFGASGEIAASKVNSVFDRTGDIFPVAGDYNSALIIDQDLFCISAESDPVKVVTIEKKQSIPAPGSVFSLYFTQGSNIENARLRIGGSSYDLVKNPTGPNEKLGKIYPNYRCRIQLSGHNAFWLNPPSVIKVIDDTVTNQETTWSSAKIDEELFHPQHTTMVVTAMQEGVGFKADYSAGEIKNHADAGGVIILRFNAPDNTGEQSYQYETYRDGKAIFRRPFINKNTISRINIEIDDKRNVNKVEESFAAASIDDIQLLEDNKADYKLKVIANDYVTQNDAREVLTFLDQYDGRLIEFLTNGENPSKAVATGRVFTDKEGNSFLITYNKDGTTTYWTKDSYEKHNIECRSFINVEMLDLDTLTIDKQGEAPFLSSVQKAINKPRRTSDFGIVVTIAYSISKQTQIYRDIETNRTYTRLITGTADQHMFHPWKSDFGMGIEGAKVGQCIQIAAVDENGVPTAYKAVDIPQR